jgi:hypothetical protein
MFGKWFSLRRLFLAGVLWAACTGILRICGMPVPFHDPGDLLRVINNTGKPMVIFVGESLIGAADPAAPPAAKAALGRLMEAASTIRRKME